MTREDKETLKTADQLSDEDLSAAVGGMAPQVQGTEEYRAECNQCSWFFDWTTDYTAFLNAISEHKNASGHTVSEMSRGKKMDPGYEQAP
ncbi:MAG: hypothetical protein ACM3UW_06020 [Bacillota bacterium]